VRSCASHPECPVAGSPYGHRHGRKLCRSFPYNAKLCINGNGGPSARPCDRLTPPKIDALLRKWLGRLPHPFTRADRAAGYRYDISVLQAEFSLTRAPAGP